MSGEYTGSRRRRCRWCRELFWPKKSFYWYCCWDCRERHQEDYIDGRKDDATDESYRKGWQAGYNTGYIAGEAAMKEIYLRDTAKNGGLKLDLSTWRKLIGLVHPDKHNNSVTAKEVTQWLIMQKPN